MQVVVAIALVQQVSPLGDSEVSKFILFSGPKLLSYSIETLLPPSLTAAGFWIIRRGTFRARRQPEGKDHYGVRYMSSA